MYGSSDIKELYRTRQVTDEEIRTLFKGVAQETDAVVTNEYAAEDIESVWGRDGGKIPRAVPDMMFEPCEGLEVEPGVLGFQNRLGDSCENAASWLQNTYWFYMRYVAALFARAAKLERKTKLLEEKLLLLKSQRGQSVP